MSLCIPIVDVIIKLMLLRFDTLYIFIMNCLKSVISKNIRFYAAFIIQVFYFHGMCFVSLVYYILQLAFTD